MRSFQSQIKSRQTTRSPAKYDVPKNAILFGHIPLEEMPSKEPEIQFGNSNMELLPTKYKDALRRIARTIAIEGGWSAARINKDIHNTTTRGTHRNFDHLLPSLVIGSGRSIQVMPDDPHITVTMESEDFPRLNRTVHINTTVVAGDAVLKEPQNRAEMFDRKKYPLGFPFDHLRAKGLSEHSSRLQPPKQEYARRYNIWRRKQRKLARKESIMNFDSFSVDCPELPARSAAFCTSYSDSPCQSGPKTPWRSNNRFSILAFLTEHDDISDDIDNASFTSSSAEVTNSRNEYTTHPKNQNHAKPSFAQVARYTTSPNTANNAVATTTSESSSLNASPVANTSPHISQLPTPTVTVSPKTPVTTRINCPPAAPKPSPTKNKPLYPTNTSTRKTTNDPAPPPHKRDMDRPGATEIKRVHLVQGHWLQGPPMYRSQSGRE